VEKAKTESEHLPPGLLQAVIFCLEECRGHLRSGLESSNRQISAASYLKPEQRAAIMPGLTKQQDHYSRSIGTVDYILAKCHQKMRWPSVLRKMTPQQATESGITLKLWEVMGWQIESELQAV